MRTPVPFDTHAFVKRLIAAGVPETQAEAHAENLAEVVAHLVTKEDLAQAVQQIEHKIELARQDSAQRQTQSERKLTIRVGVIVSAVAGIALALARILFV